MCSYLIKCCATPKPAFTAAEFLLTCSSVIRKWLPCSIWTVPAWQVFRIKTKQQSSSDFLDLKSLRLATGREIRRDYRIKTSQIAHLPLWKFLQCPEYIYYIYTACRNHSLQSLGLHVCIFEMNALPSCINSAVPSCDITNPLVIHHKARRWSHWQPKGWRGGLRGEVVLKGFLNFDNPPPEMPALRPTGSRENDLKPSQRSNLPMC